MWYLIQFSYRPDGETQILPKCTFVGRVIGPLFVFAPSLGARHRHALSCWPSSDAYLDVWERRTSTVIQCFDVRSPMANALHLIPDLNRSLHFMEEAVPNTIARPYRFFSFRLARQYFPLYLTLNLYTFPAAWRQIFPLPSGASPGACGLSVNLVPYL